MKNITLLFLIFTSLNCFSKSTLNEFEGVIYYTKFMSELNNSTSARKHKEFLNESLGQKSVFYYKNGKHLWDRIVTGGKELYYKNSNYLYVKKKQRIQNMANK